jgi:hypothetical protein
MMGAKRYLEIVEIETREIVKRVDVTGKSERNIERVMSGMLTNMSEKFFVRDTL